MFLVNEPSYHNVLPIIRHPKGVADIDHVRSDGCEAAHYEEKEVHYDQAQRP